MMIKSECQMILDICAQTQVRMIIRVWISSDAIFLPQITLVEKQNFMMPPIVFI